MHHPLQPSTCTGPTHVALEGLVCRDNHRNSSSTCPSLVRISEVRWCTASCGRWATHLPPGEDGTSTSNRWPARQLHQSANQEKMGHQQVIDGRHPVSAQSGNSQWPDVDWGGPPATQLNSRPQPELPTVIRVAPDSHCRLNF